jgi:HEAT repeat protein
MFRAPSLPRTREAAFRDLGADKAAVRAGAARDLVAHAADAHAEVVRALAKALRHDRAADVRAAAATALSDVGASEALPDLLLAVEDDDALVRQMDIAALGEIGDPRATERLRRALGDERAEVRFQAVMAFPRVSASTEAALEALLHATEDRDPLVCHIALRMTEEVRDGGPTDPRVLARARALLDHASAQVRVVAAVLVASKDDPRVARILAGVARGEEKTGDRRDPLAWHARVALARMGHERACREILRELGDRDRDVRTLAVAAAGRAHLVAARERILAMRGDERRADPHAVDEALSALADPPSSPMTPMTPMHPATP